MLVDQKLDCVTVLGGSGFLGCRVVDQLVKKGIKTRIAVRHPQSAGISFDKNRDANIEEVYADVRDETSVSIALEGSSAVVNSVGLYVENGSETFESVHELGALAVAHQCAEQGVARLVHISGIGADLYSACSYIRARARGELLVRDVFPQSTILRPSVIFGPEDKFLNTLANISRFTPVIPLFGSGNTRLQPVYVDDVAGTAVAALQIAEAPKSTYEIGGPCIYTYRELIELVLQEMKIRRPLLPIPFACWDSLAATARFLPKPPITRAQVTLMRHDNVVGPNNQTIADLGITPSKLTDILPQYAFVAPERDLV